jgi:hypothetical protein
MVTTSGFLKSGFFQGERQSVVRAVGWPGPKQVTVWE